MRISLRSISDRKLGASSDAGVFGGPLVRLEHYDAEVLSMTDYYPFGMSRKRKLTSRKGFFRLAGRSFEGSGYRYGFNGKEDDPDWNGKKGMLDYGFRIQDVRLGRFLSVDPLAPEYPELTTYQFASNTPIGAVDLDGLEATSVIGHWDPTNPNDPNSPFLGPQLALTSFYDVKHSLYNILLQLRSAPEGYHYEARYRRDKSGNEIFSTEAVLVDNRSVAEQALNTTLDFLNIAAAGRLDATDFLGVRATSAPQLTAPLRKALNEFYRATSKFAEQYKCVEYANNAMRYAGSLSKKALSELGISEIRHRSYQGPRDELIGDLSRQYATNGKHEWIEVTIDGVDYVFDNMNKKGVLKSDYFGPKGVMGSSAAEGLKAGKKIEKSANTTQKIETK